MNKSESIGKLALALSKFQGEVKNVIANKKGYGYMYADLAQVLDVTRPLCAKHELAVTQLCSTDEKGGVTVETVLLHSSGEWLTTTIAVPVSVSKGLSAAQGVGVCITYGRRYALCALLGVAQEDEDTDAALPKDKEEPVATVADVATTPQDKMTGKLKSSLGNPNELPVQRLRKLITEHKLEAKEAGWLEHFKVDSLDKLGADEVLKLIKTIEVKV